MNTITGTRMFYFLIKTGDDVRYAQDPKYKDLILFYEYFHGDTGRGCGAR